MDKCKYCDENCIDDSHNCGGPVNPVDYMVSRQKDPKGGFMFGKHKENGIWKGKKKQWRIMFFEHDALYVSAGYWRLRLMKFWAC